jgi:hypothetical protein
MKWLLGLLVVAVAALLPASPSSAQQARQIPISIDDHFQDDFYRAVRRRRLHRHRR